MSETVQLAMHGEPLSSYTMLKGHILAVREIKVLYVEFKISSLIVQPLLLENEMKLKWFNLMFFFVLLQGRIFYRRTGASSSWAADPRHGNTGGRTLPVCCRRRSHWCYCHSHTYRAHRPGCMGPDPPAMHKSSRLQSRSPFRILGAKGYYWKNNCFVFFPGP